MPKPGEAFAGRYTIERRIGRGGMGEVFLARQAPLDRFVALKILKPPESIEDDPRFDARFLREAAAAARLQHPNTITVYDFGQTEPGHLYIVMEFLEGTDVRAALAHEGIFSAHRAIHVAKQVCKGLREAHVKGIIHRDLKPANVLLIERDEDMDFVKVLDFGLVKFRGEVSDITLAGKFLGSPRYTSPESLDRHAVVDHRADIYATGILLYTMLTGSPPFDGDPMQVLNAHLHEQPQPMYRANPAAQTTPELEALVMKCLEKEPAKRFQSMSELLEALREVGSYFGDEHTETLDLELSESSIPDVPEGRLLQESRRPPGSSVPSASVTTSHRDGKIVVEVNVAGVDGSTVTRTVTREEPSRRKGLLVLGLLLSLAVGAVVAVLVLNDRGDEMLVPSSGVVYLQAAPAATPAPTPEGGEVSVPEPETPTLVEAGAPEVETTPAPAPVRKPPVRPPATKPAAVGTKKPERGDSSRGTEQSTPAPKKDDEELKLPVGYKDNPY
jgi:serine/threonine-protein kinase